MTMNFKISIPEESHGAVNTRRRGIPHPLTAEDEEQLREFFSPSDVSSAHLAARDPEMAIDMARVQRKLETLSDVHMATLDTVYSEVSRVDMKRFHENPNDFALWIEAASAYAQARP